MRDTLTPFLSQGESPSTGRLRRSLFVGAFVALVTLALIVPPAAVGSGTADEGTDILPGADSDLFPLVGELTFHGDDGERVGAVEPVGVDPEIHRAVFFREGESGGELRLIDTRSLEHLDVIDLPEGFEGDIPQKRAVIDAENHRVYLPTFAPGTATGEEHHGCAFIVFVACNATRPVQPVILTVSLTGEHPPVATHLEMTLAPEEEQLQTKIATRLAYHAPTDRVYVVTESGNFGGNGNPYTTLHEFRAADLLAGADGHSAEAVWSSQLESCGLAVSKYGGFLARSVRDDFVYLPCKGGEDGMHGAVRVDLGSGADPADFEERFHPFAADLDKGGATGDPVNDLIFFVGSAAGSNRLFTFDAYQEAWTGASSMPEAGDVVSPTTNRETGRIYALTGGGGENYAQIRVTEGDRVAVPNGQGYDAGVIAVGAQPQFDSSTRRLFLNSAKMCLDWTEDWDAGRYKLTSDESRCAVPEAGEVPHFRVFEDRLPDAPKPESYDFDQDTEDVSEADGPVFSSAAANATAFGARYLFVGGTQSSRPTGYQGHIRDAVVGAPLGPSARQVIRAEVDEASLLRFTATPTIVASATGLTIGEQTGSDVKRNSQLASEEEDSSGLVSGRDWPDDFPEEMRGYQAYCDDFGGEPTQDAKAGAAVSCDSGQLIGQAGALYTVTDEQAPVQVGYAETSVEVREDDTSGSVATATAVARDIDLFGQISIGEIRTEATAVARGRPGTAATELTREYRQVRIGGGFACGWGDDDRCDVWEVVRAINELGQPRLTASVPAQDTTLNPNASDEPDNQPGEARVSNGTPGGAKAGVTLDPYDARSNETINQDQRTELPGLQIVYYDDHDKVSRHIFQFAAVNLDTYYTVNSAPTFDPPDWANGDGGFGGGDDGFGDGTGPGEGLPGDLGVAARTVTPPPVMALGEEPVAPAEELELDSGGSTLTTGDADEFEAGDGTSGLEQGQAPSLGTAEGPALDMDQDAPAPEVAPDASPGEQAVVAQGQQGGSSGPGGLILTRQRMGETVPLAVLWVLAALPFYLAVRRRRLLTSSAR